MWGGGGTRVEWQKGSQACMRGAVLQYPAARLHLQAGGGGNATHADPWTVWGLQDSRRHYLQISRFRGVGVHQLN